MKKELLTIATVALLMVSCGKKDAGGNFPENFNTIGDAGRVDYMIRMVEPDSVARFIIYGALGKVPGAKIDSLAIATNQAYEKLKGDQLETFSTAYDALVESLPLGDKMKVYMLGGSEDPQGLGYKLGLEYMSSIRDKNKSVAEVEKELKAFRKACGEDTTMYNRFMIGFQTVLKVDEGKDVPQEIYNKYVNIHITQPKAEIPAE